MKIKNTLFCIISLLLTVSILFGCGKNPTDEEGGDADAPQDSAESSMVIPSGLPDKLSDGRTPSDFPNEQDFISAFITEHEYGEEYELAGAEAVRGGNNIFDGDLYALNPETGFYQRYDKDAGTYGEILYAHITSASRFYDKPLSEIEYAGNNNLTLFGDNYKFFIEGKGAFSKGYFCVRDEYASVFCPCIDSCGGVCPVGCENCHEECNNAPSELISSLGGYADFSNSDGLCPVTEELKEFLLRFSECQALFYNGLGWVENHPSVSAEAINGGEWLFDCVLYVRK